MNARRKKDIIACRDNDQDVADCPACDRVFCTKCLENYHGCAKCKDEDCAEKVEETEKQQEEDLEAASAITYYKPPIMVAKLEAALQGYNVKFLKTLMATKGIDFTRKLFNEYIDNVLFAHLDEEDRRRAARAYDTTHKIRRSWDDVYGAALARYYLSEVLH